MLCNPSLWFVSPQGKGGGRAAPAGGVGASPQQERDASEEPAVLETRPEEAFFSRLDSSHEEEHGVRQEAPHAHGGSSAARCSRDFDSLNLSKYIGEAVSSMVEAKLKISEWAALWHLCSLFHPALRRLRTASPRRLEEALRGQEGGEVTQREQTADRPALHRRAHHRGLFTDKEGLSLIYEQLKNIISTDRETHTHVSVIISFCKHCGDDIAGLVPRKVKNAGGEVRLVLPSLSDH